MVVPPQAGDPGIDPTLSRYDPKLEQSSEKLSDLLQPHFRHSLMRQGRVKISDMTFGERLDKLITGTGISVNELAKRLGCVSPNTIHRWIAGNIQPRLDEVAAVAEFFDKPFWSLVGEGHVPRPSSPDLTRDEDLILETFHSLGLDRREAIRRLHGSEDAVIAAFRELKISEEEAIRRLRVAPIVEVVERETGREAKTAEKPGKKKGVR
jgi:transcriptional regulator with XRE-family HTH domain